MGTIIRGDEVVSLLVEGPPPADTVRSKTQSSPVGSGVGYAAGRCINPTPTSQIPAGLTGLVKGLGGPAPGSMQPRPKPSIAPHTYLGARPLSGGMHLTTPGMPSSGIPLSTARPGI